MGDPKVLFSVFRHIPDPRRPQGNFRYPLEEIFFLVISAVVSGLEDWVHIEEFGNDQLDWLRRYYTYEHGIPSHDCLGRVFSALDTQAFGEVFVQWSQGLSQHTAGQVVSIDGKTLRRSYDHYQGKAAIHLISAFASANSLVLGQVKTQEKSNEISAIPDLLDLIFLDGCVVTIDAMGCQKDIAAQIREKKEDYVLALKSNQPELYEEVKRAFQIMPIEASYTSVNSDHGRIEERICEVITDFRFIDEAAKWPGMQAVAKVKARRTHKNSGQTEEQDRYYICSLTKAEKISEAVRAHWGIENSLHWVLDVQFCEDLSRKRKGKMPANFALITKMVINMIKKHPAKGSIKVKRMKAAWNQNFRQQILFG